MIIKNRIKKHTEFQEVIGKGKFERSPSLAMYYLSNNLGYTRVGISVPKKSGNAVTRNKIKRQIRAICSELLNFKPSLDIVFIVRKTYDTNSFLKTKEEMSGLLNLLG